ncbi:MAG: hypothetical protein ABSA66_19685 [Roseiarcus sp.]|jgi:hypothetical protein
MGSAARLERPDHIAKIGECLTLWPDVDTQLALLLAALTKANTSGIVAVYSILRRSTGRVEAIKAAAGAMLDGEGQELISAIMVFLQTVEAARNDLAHGHWGCSHLIPEGILWLDGTYTINFHVKHRQTVIIERREFPTDILSNMYYYRIKDFEEIKKQILILCEVIFTMRVYVDSFHAKPTYHTNDAICAQLRSYGPIRQALAQKDVRANLPNRPI